MAEQLSSMTVTSADFEEAFGRSGRFGPISLRVGDDDVFVEGRIDRADYMDVGGDQRVRIIDYKKAREEVNEIIERYGLQVDLDKKVKDISVEMQQKTYKSMYISTVQKKMQHLQ